MLRLHNVRCQVQDKQLFELEHLALSAGKLTAVVGPNGAGKSSVIRAINQDLPYQGDIYLNNCGIYTLSDTERARHLAILHQSSPLNFNFSAEEVVALGLTPLNMQQDEASQQIQQLMEATHCWHLAKQPYPILSGGEQQRVHLARVLLQLQQAEHPPVLLLDEPTSSQDLGQQHYILQLLTDLCQHKNFCILAILHDLNQVLRYSDECIVLDKGQVVAHGDSRQVLSAELIESVWQYKPKMIEHIDGFTVIV